MPHWCNVLGCLTNVCRRKNEPEALKRSIFRIPTRNNQFKKWAEVVPHSKAHKLNAVSSGVCELHFEEQYIQRDFCNVIDGKVIRMPRGRVTLTSGAIPSIFPGREKSPTTQACHEKQRLPKAGKQEVSKSGARTYVLKAVRRGPLGNNEDADETIEEEYIGESQLSEVFLRDLRGISEAPLILKTEPIEEDEDPWQLNAVSGFPGNSNPDPWQVLPYVDSETAGGKSSSYAFSETHSYIPAVPTPDVPSAFAPSEESCNNEVLSAAETIWISEIKNEPDEFPPRPNPLADDSAESESASIAKLLNCAVASPRQCTSKRKKNKRGSDPFAGGGSSERKPKLFVPVSVETFSPDGSGVKILGGRTVASKGGCGMGARPVSSVLLTMLKSTEVPTPVRLLGSAPEIDAKDRNVVQIRSEPKVMPKLRPIDFLHVVGGQVPTMLGKLCATPEVDAKKRKIRTPSEPKVTPKHRPADFSDSSEGQLPTILRKMCPTPEITARRRKVQKLSEPKVTPKLIDSSHVVGGQVPTMRKLCATPEVAARKTPEVAAQVPTMLRDLLNAPLNPYVRPSSRAERESKEIKRLRRESSLERRRRYMEKVHKAQDIHTYFSAVIQCCRYKCYSSIPDDRQRQLFHTFYSFGDYNKQNHFLARLMRRCEPQGSAQRGDVVKTRKRVRWRYCLFVDGTKKFVCKQMLNAVLQININRLDVVQSRLHENKFDSGDVAAKRRRRRLLNDGGDDAWSRLREFCERLPHAMGRCEKTGADVNYFDARDLTLVALLEEFGNYYADVTGRSRSFKCKAFESQFFHRMNFRFRTGAVPTVTA